MELASVSIDHTEVPLYTDIVSNPVSNPLIPTSQHTYMPAPGI